MNEFLEKFEKLLFQQFLPKIAKFTQFFVVTKNNNFLVGFEYLYSPFQALSNCKISEKSDNLFRENSIAEKRTRKNGQGNEITGAYNKPKSSMDKSLP